MNFQKSYNLILILFLLPGMILFGCNQKRKIKDPLFIALDPKVTGIDFINKLEPTSEFNMFNYMYFYNGAGVGAGDFNISDFSANFQPWLSWFCSFKITFSIIDKYIPAAGI